MPTALKAIFDNIPATYELVNHLMTLGLDLPMRRYAARTAGRHLAVKSGLARKYLDVCAGTGDMSRLLSPYAGPDGLLVASDFSLPMLRYTANSGRHIRVSASEAARLSFKDNTFDLVSISFATRNINSAPGYLDRCLREFHRVLRPGGMFINLETSQPSDARIRALAHLYVGATIRPLGGLISGNGAAYGYLARSIPRFHDAAELARIIRQAGFNRVDYQPLVLGILALHWAIK
ncbi:MAG: ubiquinone/menaquinone biosynthesis methyltransferase [Candidatus Brocadiia bacterium]